MTCLKLLLERFENLNSISGLQCQQTNNERTPETYATWGTHVELFLLFQYCSQILKDLRWEVTKPLTTKNLHYPVSVNNEDELFTTQQSHMELLYYPNTHYDSIVDCNTELCSTTKPQIKSFTDTTGQSQVIEL